MHWLVAAAQRAQIAGAAQLQVARGATLNDAWDSVARALGLSSRELAQRIAPGMRLAVADLEAGEPRALKLIPEKIARKHHVYPLREDDRTIVVATADPTDLGTEQALEFAAGRRVTFQLAPPGAIAEAINAGYSPDRAVERLLTTVDAEIADAVRVVDEMEPETVAVEEVDAAPVVKLSNLILREGVASGASDIHIEPGPKGGVVRFRVDGVMRVYMHLPAAALNRVVSRIKVLGKLDIADRLRPQDGRARIELDGGKFDLRISTVPTRDAEKAVIRILRPDTTRQLDDCRLAQRELVRIRQLLTYRDGIVIVTGPTGSGKTTTLYSAIKEIATGDINIMTVEDPIEYELPGITQMQVEAKRGVTFASALRAILRQDPDVIFVGEIRDEETAQVAAQAAMTGHLVLATLHTNDAMSAVTRLADLGLDRATVAATLRGSVAQRLVRRACPDCAVPLGPADELTEREQRLAAAYGMRPVVRAAGCARCSMTGFLGRIPVNEVAVVTPHLAEQIAAGATMQALQRAAVSAGMRTLREVALERAAKGETTLQEVERVLGDTSVEAPPPEAAQPARPRVLVVDDDPVTRTLAATLLDGAGFSVVQADDGDVALERLQAGEEFSLVVTDLHMARMNGDQLLAALRGNVQTAGLPVIVLTGSAEYETEVALMDAGADDYIRKPIDPPRFMARVKAALRRAGA